MQCLERQHCRHIQKQNREKLHQFSRTDGKWKFPSPIEIRFFIENLNWLGQNHKNKNEGELPAPAHRSVALITAFKRNSQQISVSATWLRLYRPVFPSLQPSSPIPSSSLRFGPISYKQTSCPKTAPVHSPGCLPGLRLLSLLLFCCSRCAFLVTAALLGAKRANFYSCKMKNMFQTWEGRNGRAAPLKLTGWPRGEVIWIKNQFQ